MTNAEIIATIRNEIERLKGICTAQIKANPGQTFPFVMEMTGYDKLLSFLSTLEKSEKPMNPEDAMKELDEKIALVKQRGTWDGVDVDKYMDEVRGREPEKPVPKDLKEAVKNYIYKAADSPGDDWTTDDIRKAYIAGYKLHEANTPLPEDTVLFQKGVDEGKRLMMEEAVKWLMDDDYDPKTEKGRFILGSVGIGYNGYYIPYSDLLKLPKEDEK